MTDLVGHANCPQCGKKSEVRKNKRSKLLLKCPVHSIFPYQSTQGQTDLKTMTVFISENPAPIVASGGSEPAEPIPEPVPVVPEKSRTKWSFFR